ncbi:hypothetical protein PVK06_041463 [Gossypium arboreum]|uniref:E3 ubiquitin-protein ligase HERC2 n=1 Tax=Gossypium arboreum TaxID=29729 RepID=A0ABR0N8A4_GOSAR|nr:hypothetical protein PVK06_041463 [Gossypium arboreum]
MAVNQKAALKDGDICYAIYQILSCYFDDGTYAMKKVLIQNNEQLELVREEIRLVIEIFFPFLIMLSFLLRMNCFEDGELYMWGKNSSGQLGLGKNAAKAVHKPTKVECLSGLTIKLDALGSEHTIVVTETGSLFVFGDKVVANLGFGEAKNATMPSMINTLPYSEEVACGGYHTCVVTSDRDSV